MRQFRSIWNNSITVKAFKVLWLSTLTPVEIAQVPSMRKRTPKANEKLADKVGARLLLTYSNTKKLTFQYFQYSFKSSCILAFFPYNQAERVHRIKMDFQYLTRNVYREFLKCIVVNWQRQSYQEIYCHNSAFLNYDGIVYWTRTGKIYIIVEVITKSGDKKQYFLGASESCNSAKEVLVMLGDTCSKTDGPTAASLSSRLGHRWSICQHRTEVWFVDSLPIEVEGYWPQIFCSSAEKLMWIPPSNLAWKSTNNFLGEAGHMCLQLVELNTGFHNQG